MATVSQGRIGARRARVLAAIAVSAATIVVTGPLFAQAPPARPAAQETPAANRLPVRRVVLYKSGVGYFEHLGRVRGDQQVTIDFTSGQLNDVLKSLTTLDLDGGRVTGINYNSEAALDRRLGALRLPVGAQATRAQLLTALRGARVDVTRGPTRLIGRVLSVERSERRSDGVATPVDVLALVTEAGEVTTVVLDPGVEVRIVEAELRQEVSRYLSLMSSIRDQDLRRVTIGTAGTGDRNLFVSYMSEVPVWKATYRLVLPSGGRRPFLQGWAIVDNTVGEDWNDVELSLVAGAPQSFVQSISQPYYVRRPVVPLPESVSLSPQTHQAAMTLSVPSAAPMPPPPPPPPAAPAGRVGGGGGRGGGGGGRIAGLPETTINRSIDGVATDSFFSAVVPRLDAVEDAMLAQQTAASAAQLGDLFEYKLRERVTIRKDQSALVPIVAAEVDVEKVSLWNSMTGGPRPLRAVWLTNSTGLTLDGGSFSVVDGQAFAGEGLIDSLRAGEKRLLSYALDLGLHMDSKVDPTPARIVRVQIARGLLIRRTEERQRRTYIARNEDSEARVLVLEHPVRVGWTLAPDVKPAESTAAWHRFRVTVAPKSTAELTVDESRQVSSEVQVSSMTDDQVTLLVRERALTPETEAALREVLTRKAEIARLSAEIARREREASTITDDQARLRENMKALSGSSEEKQLRQRYVKQLDDQESRLEVLQREAQALTVERTQAQAGLARFIEGLSL